MSDNSPIAEFILHNDKSECNRYELIADTYTIGRDSSCDIIIELDTVSRVHAKIKREGPRYILYDNRSSNGTFVNGQIIDEPHLLTDQDGVGLGEPRPTLRFKDFNPTKIHSNRLPYTANPLTKRESEILCLIAADLSAPEIAQQLKISVETARSHIKNIYGKLEVHSRFEAVERAKGLNLL